MFSGLYDLPFGRGKKYGSSAGRITDYLIGGWQMNLILTLQSGLPFTPYLASNGLNNGNFQLPNRIGRRALPDSQRTIQRWFNTSISPSDPNRAFEFQPSTRLEIRVTTFYAVRACRLWT